MAPTQEMRITHVLFDMDGVLLDTESFYTVVQDRISRQYGKSFDWGLKSKMLGKKASEAAQVFVREQGLEGVLDPADFIRQRELALDEMFPTAALLPGVERLVRHLKMSGVPACVATSSTRKGFELKTTRHKEVFGLFDHVVTGDEVTNGKPAPEIFLKAASRWLPAPDPAACLVIEDAPSGVAAGKAAGMRVLMVPDRKLDPGLCKGHDELVYSLEDFDPEAWGLPPFPSDN